MNETAVGLDSVKQSLTDEADEEYCCTTGLSDADILEAFLKDGCDLDGTPLWLKNEDHISRSTIHTTRRLH